MKQIPIPETNYIVELFLYDCAGQSIFNQLDFNSKYVSLFCHMVNDLIASYDLHHFSIKMRLLSLLYTVLPAKRLYNLLQNG